MFSKILVPIDGRRWLGTLAHARTLGEKFGTEITVMHVVQPYNTIPSIDGSPLFIPRDIEAIQETGRTPAETSGRQVVRLPVCCRDQD